MSGEDLAPLFESIGLTPEKAKETAANKKIAPNLHLAIKEAGFMDGVDKTTGALLYYLASTANKGAIPHIPYIAKAIGDKRLLNNDQVSAAIKFCQDVKGTTIDKKKFDHECGVGVVVTHEQMASTVKKAIESRKAELVEKRYQIVGALLGAVRQQLRWANALALKEEFDKQILATIGPKDERDDPKNKKKEKKETKAAAKDAPKAEADSNVPGRIAEAASSFRYIFEGELSKLHKPGGNKQINDRLMKEHLKRTGGKVVTRFPPEPNGFLHIGHAKAININFGYAKAHNGICYLRYDDTNPEAEEDVYFKSIFETVRWLGFEPYKITYSSDHFQRLYDLAVDLIKRDKAYVCHCTAEEMFEMRGGESKGARTDCKHRNRPISESLREFRKMKEGRYAEGEATLRMKMDMQHPSPQFWDLVAYRIMYTPHVRTGDAWCIYPTYDYTHCLCDSFEDITHSLCTTEFILNRESYYWLVDALEIYKPVQWEYGRLKLTNTVLSKRKLMKLVNEKVVAGWDDPRLFTLDAIRRRGFTAEAICAFVRDLGVTTNNSTIPVERLENYVRDHLNDVAPRLMSVLEPLKLTLVNLPEGHVEEISVPNKPRDDAMGSHIVPFTRTVYIDRSDFREKDDDPNFRRLAPGKTVGLLNVPFPVTATEVIRDPSTGTVVEVKCRYENDPKTKIKPKTYIQWVADSPSYGSPVRVEVRLYSNLFMHPDPDNKDQVPGGWMSDINPDSLTIVKDAFVEIGVKGAKIEDKFQFQRLGYFCVDRDSEPKKGRYVFNRTVTLKEDSKKDK
ncbi:hypothetical protein HK102_005063 [Quaeritorhiza haematococci]|nr:hypothetical protein HK102_005063 [Quaeritorhiza haematococci]